MTATALVLVILVEVAALAVLLVIQTYDTLKERRRQRFQSEFDEARQNVVTAVASDQITSATIYSLSRLPPSDRDDVLCSVAVVVQSHQDPTFQELASLVGTVERIERGLYNRRWWKRLYALKRLTVLGLSSHRARELLDDPDPRVRSVAAQWAAIVEPSEGTSERLALMLGDGSDRVRHSASIGLFQLGTAASEALRVALRTEDRTRMRAALGLIAVLGDRRLASKAWDLVEETDPDIKADAIRAVTPVLDEEHAELLEELIRSSHEVVRSAAVVASGEARLSCLAGPIASRVTGDQSIQVREAAISALRRLGETGEILLRYFTRHGRASL